MEQCNRSMYVSHDDSLFTSTVEEVGGFIYLHCKVHRNTPGAIREVKRELGRLLEGFHKEGIEHVFCYLVKGRFAALLGGEYLNSFPSEGEIYEVYKYATSSFDSYSNRCRSRNSQLLPTE